MNTKKTLCIVTLLLMTLITACEVVQTAEIISNEDPEGQEEAALTDVAQDENENQEALPLLADVDPPMDSQTSTTNQNALELTEIQYLGKGNINAIAWSPSGNPIALATVTGIYLIDPQTKEEVHYTKTPSNRIDFLPDSSVLSSVEESQVIFRDLKNKREPLILGGQIEDTTEIAFSPSGDLVAIASNDGTVIIKDLVSEKVVSTINKPETSFYYHMSFSQDGKILVSNVYYQESDHSDVLIWDVESGDQIVTASVIGGSNSAVSPNSELIAAGGYDDPLRLLDFNGQVQKILDEKPKPVIGLAFSPDGKILGSITLNNTEDSWTKTTLKLWDTANGELLYTLDDVGEYHYISFSPDNTQVAAAAFDQVKLWDVESGQEIGIITDQTDSFDNMAYGTGGGNDFAWSPDGKTLALATFTDVTLVDRDTHEKIHLSTVPNQHGRNISFSPDGHLLAIASFNQDQGVVDVYDIKSLELLYTLNEFGDNMAFGIAFGSGGTLLATGWGNAWGFPPGGVKLWDMSTGDLIAEYTHEGLATIYNLTFNREGNLLATISGEGYVNIWDIESGQDIQQFQGTGGYGYAVAFSPDGKILGVGGAATSDDATVCLRLIDLETEEILFDLQGHQDWYVGSIAFNADGGVLASASWDGTVRLWDTHTGEQLAVLDIPGATSVGFSPDGTLLATVGFGDVLRIWSVTESRTNIEGSSPDTAIEISTIQASALSEDFRPGRWSPDGRYIYYTDQGPIDEPGPDQAYQTLTFLDAQSGETCFSIEEIVNLSFNPWSETMIPKGPLIQERAFWMNDNRLLYLSPDGELFAITPCSDSIEDLTTTLPESITSFYYGENFDHSQLLLKGETGTWIFTPSTGQSVKVAVPESALEEETHFAWSPWEAKLVSSRVESGDGGLRLIIEIIDPVTGDSEIIAEFPVVNERGSWRHSIGGFLSWTAKNQIFLHYLDNYHEKENLIDLSSRPVEITHVFTDLFGIEPPSLNSELTLFGETNITGEEDYYLSVGTGLSPDGKLYLYSAKTGLVETYSLDTSKLFIFPDGDVLFGETYDETIQDMPLQIIQIGSDSPHYNLEINGKIPGQYKHGKIILVDDDQHLLVCSDQEISLIDVESGEMLQSWVLENHEQYNDFLLSPSPDGNSVIIYAAQIDKNEDWLSGQNRAIFLLNLDS